MFINYYYFLKVKNNSLNWALGYMINELNRDDFLPYEQPPRKLNLFLYIPLVIILGFFITTLFVSILYYRLVIKRRVEIPNANPLLEKGE